MNHHGMITDYPIIHTPEYPRKQDNTERYGPSPTAPDRLPLKAITFAQLDRPATPLLDKDTRQHDLNQPPNLPYEDVPPRPPLPNIINQGMQTN